VNGILLDVEPVLVRWGSLSIRWYGVLLIVALVIGSALAVRRAIGVTVPTGAVALDLLSWVLLAGLLGARLLHLLEHWQFYASRPGAVLDLGNGGLSAWGALIFGGAALAVQARQRCLSLPRLADASAPSLAVGDSIAQFGCLINGDGQGVPAELPWATRYQSIDALSPDFGVARHPCQIYQLLADLLILGLLGLLRATPLASGARFCIWLGLYGLSRVVIGAVRLDPPLLLGLQLAQLLGLAAVVVAAAVLIRMATRPAGWMAAA
jgi:phosphatidylglycerol---prolipoprotein diacylglyceryl transferase